MKNVLKNNNIKLCFIIDFNILSLFNVQKLKIYMTKTSGCYAVLCLKALFKPVESAALRPCLHNQNHTSCAL